MSAPPSAQSASWNQLAWTRAVAGLSPTDGIMCAALYYAMRADHRTGIVPPWVTREVAAEDTARAEKTIMRALKWLAHCGFVERRGADGGALRLLMTDAARAAAVAALDEDTESHGTQSPTGLTGHEIAPQVPGSRTQSPTKSQDLSGVSDRPAARACEPAGATREADPDDPDHGIHRARPIGEARRDGAGEASQGVEPVPSQRGDVEPPPPSLVAARAVCRAFTETCEFQPPHGLALSTFPFPSELTAHRLVLWTHRHLRGTADLEADADMAAAGALVSTVVEWWVRSWYAGKGRVESLGWFTATWTEGDGEPVRFLKQLDFWRARDATRGPAQVSGGLAPAPAAAGARPTPARPVVVAPPEPPDLRTPEQRAADRAEDERVKREHMAKFHATMAELARKNAEVVGHKGRAERPAPRPDTPEELAAARARRAEQKAMVAARMAEEAGA